MFLTASVALLVAVAPALVPAPTSAKVRATHSPAETLEVLVDLAGAPAASGGVSVASSVTGGGRQQTELPATPLARPPRRRILRQGGAPPRELTVMLPGDVTLELVRSAGGTPFMMGAPLEERVGSPWERPQHRVTIARDYYLGKYEVTQAQWEAVTGTNPARRHGVGRDLPAYGISWDEIAGPGGFLEKLNRALGTTSFRLPTEAEWEYAARAGTTTAFSFPAPADWDRECGSFPAAQPYMWWCGVDWMTGPLEVGQLLPNPWGLFDIHGNVLEWVQDRFHDSFADAPTDGNAWEAGTDSWRMVRGGAWNVPAVYCRSAMRLPLPPAHQCFNLGFRLAASIP